MKSLVKFERVEGDNYDTMGISFYIYGGCKFNCSYCFLVGYNRSAAWRARAAPQGFKHQPPVEQHCSVVDVLFRLKQKFFIYLYGGEPTEYKHTHELIEYINSKPRDIFSHIEMQTNLNTTRDDLKRYCDYKYLNISPTLHLDHLKGDTIHDLVDKIDIIYDSDKLTRIDFVMAKKSPDLVRELHYILKEKPYFDKVMYTRNFLEINTGEGGLNYHSGQSDVYTGKFNTYDQFNDICEDAIYKEMYKLTYNDGSSDIVDANELYTEKDKLNFKGWLCDAGNKLMLVDYTGDWWICDNEYIKNEPAGNMLESSSKFLLHSRGPHICKLDKCDGCFFIDRKLV
jgi:organic radical activating enzyme